MKTVEFWQWWVISERSGRRVKTRWRMAAEEAHARWPEAQQVEGSKEVRPCPETSEEMMAQSTSALLFAPKGE